MSDPGPAWSENKGIGIPDVLMFVLELALWACCFWVGWRMGSGIGRWLFAAGFGVGAMLLWALFRPPGMMGKGGVIPTPGPVRLVIEIGLFLLAGIGLWHTGYRWAAETLWTFAALIYILSHSRIRWLLEH